MASFYHRLCEEEEEDPKPNPFTISAPPTSSGSGSGTGCHSRSHEEIPLQDQRRGIACAPAEARDATAFPEEIDDVDDENENEIENDDDGEVVLPFPPPANNEDSDPPASSPASMASLADFYGRHVIARPWWFWLLGFLDIAIVIFNWTTSSNDPGKDGSYSFTTCVVIIFNYVQFCMGLVIIIARCIPKDKLLLFFIRTYLRTSYFLLAKITFVIAASIIITSKTDRFGSDRLLRIVSNMASMIIRIPAIMVIQELLKKYQEQLQSRRPIPPRVVQVGLEPPTRWRRRRLRTRGMRDQRPNPNIPLSFAREWRDAPAQDPYHFDGDGGRDCNAVNV